MKKDNYTLWKDLNFSKKKGNSKAIYHKTVKAKGYYNHFNGSTYYSLYDKDNNWLGYINANGVKEAKETGCHYAESGYVTIPNKEGTTYSNVALTKPKTDYKQYALKTVQIQSVYYRFDGTVVYSLYDNNDQWIGYISSNQLERVTSPGGSYQSLGKYVSVKKDNYTLWKDLNFSKKKGNSKAIYHKTVKAKGYYNHFNGSTYYSLYDKDNNWLGYINANGVKEAKETGCHYAESGYVTIPNKEGTTYSNVALTKPKTDYKQYALKTVQIQGVYYRFDGTVVYSLYDNNDQWIGYISSTQLERVTSPGGSYQSYGKKATVQKDDYVMWHTLDFTEKKGTSAPYYQKTYLAKGRYFHYNGSTYYSLYDDQGKWLGYIDESGLTFE